MKNIYEGKSVKVERDGHKILINVSHKLPGFLPYEITLTMTPAGFNRFKSELNKCEYQEEEN